MKRPEPTSASRDQSAFRLGFIFILVAGVAAYLFFRGPSKEPLVARGPGPARVPSLVEGEARANHPPPAFAVLPPRTQAGPAEGAITGIVYDSSGRAIEGATITALGFEVAGNAAMTAGSVRSDGNGHFSIALGEGAYQVRGEKSGYAPTSAVARTGTELALVLPGSAAIAGTVRDENGSPIARFTLDVVPAMPGHMAAMGALSSREFSAGDGSYRMESVPELRSVIVRATAPGRASAFSKAVQLKAGETRTLDLVLTAGCVVEGTLEERSGAPVAFALVDAELRVGSGLGGGSMQTANQVQSGENGHFKVEHVPPGTVLVRAYDDAHAVTTATIVAADCAAFRPVKIVLSTGGSISGVARTAQGGPVRDASLTASQRTIGYLSTRTDSDGRFRFDKLPAGPVRLELDDGTRLAVANLHVNEGEETKQDVVLPDEGKGEIRGRVTAGGKPIPGVGLQIASSSPTPNGLNLYHVTTASDGSYRLGSLIDGGYLINILSTVQGKSVAVENGAVAEADLEMAPKAALESGSGSGSAPADTGGGE